VLSAPCTRHSLQGASSTARSRGGPRLRTRWVLLRVGQSRVFLLHKHAEYAVNFIEISTGNMVACACYRQTWPTLVLLLQGLGNLAVLHTSAWPITTHARLPTPWAWQPAHSPVRTHTTWHATHRPLLCTTWALSMRSPRTT